MEKSNMVEAKIKIDFFKSSFKRLIKRLYVSI